VNVKGENNDTLGVSWILYTPQFHVAISIVAVACLIVNVAILRTVQKLAQKLGA
jgi:hypothetical protein